jgi:protein tyrosine/serine phosphatase
MDLVDPRFVELRGAFNFRDLGGLPTLDGRQTRQGVMFRSDALHHLERSDLDRLADLGIMSVVDLRSPAEVEHHGRGLLADESIGWFHLPLGDVGAPGYEPSPALAAGDLGAHYIDTLPERSETLARVIEHLADPTSLPAVFHCTAGKDRTGMVAALVLEIVGVGADEIVADYALTDPRMPQIARRYVAPDLSETDDFELLPMMRAQASSMQQFLDGLERGYGGATEWARANRVSDATLTRLRDLLVDD